MAVNWTWKTKLGEIKLRQRHVDGKYYNYKLNLYGANCLFAIIYDFVEKDEKTGKLNDMYQFYGFFNDLEHLDRCIGLKKDFNGELTNLFNGKTGRETWKKIRLNTYWFPIYKDMQKVALHLTRAGFKVELYYKAPANKKRG